LEPNRTELQGVPEKIQSRLPIWGHRCSIRSAAEAAYLRSHLFPEAQRVDE
jgi:hypothetical protein